MPAAVRIRIFPSRFEAAMALGLLTSSGLRAWLVTDDAGGAYPFQLSGGGVQLMVDASDLAAAEELLRDAPVHQEGSDPSWRA